MPYPINRLEMPNFFTKDFIEQLKEKINERTTVKLAGDASFSASISLNYACASFGSIIFKQVEGSNWPFLGLTIELFSNGNAKIIIPFPIIPQDSDIDGNAWKQLITCLSEVHAYLFDIIDGFKTLNIFIVMLQKYFDFLKSQNWDGRILIAYRLENIWRKILFFDSSALMNQVKEYGLPFAMQKNAWVPSKLVKRKHE